MRFLDCDDNKMFAENIGKLLNDLRSERSIDVTIDSFTDAGMFLNEDLQKYDAVFLDVMMDVPGIVIENNQVISDSQDIEHGYGLKNVASKMEKYGYYYAIECADGWFVFSAIFNSFTA